MWETSVRYYQKSIRIIRPIRGRKKNTNISGLT